MYVQVVGVLSMVAVLQGFFHRATARTISFRAMTASIIALLAIGAVFAAVPVVTGMITASLVSYVTAYEITLLAFCAWAIFNYRFAVTLECGTLRATPVSEQTHSDFNLGQMVLDLITIANRERVNSGLKPYIDPDNILVATFADQHGKRVISTYGAYKNSGIFIPSGIVTEYGLTEREIAALIMVELMMVRNANARLGWMYTISKMVLAGLASIENWEDSPFMLMRGIGFAVGTLQLVSLAEKSLNRAYRYEAIRNTVDCGLGEPLLTAYKRIKNPSEDRGRAARCQNPIRYRPSLPDRVVTVAMKGCNELRADMPLNGNAINFIEGLLRSDLGKRRADRIQIPAAVQAFSYDLCAHAGHSHGAAPSRFAQVAAGRTGRQPYNNSSYRAPAKVNINIYSNIKVGKSKVGSSGR